MHSIRVLPRVLALVLALASSLGYADDAHHPESAAKAGAAQAAPKKAPKINKAPADKLDAQMKQMRTMHEKMAGAKTPEERNALTADHMKAMHGGMSMMSDMMGRQGSGRPQSPELMQKQMDMMDMMKDMMKDRMETRDGAKPAAPVR
jgi:hypothetical protein